MHSWWESHTVANPLRVLFVGLHIYSGLVRIAEELYALNVATKQQTLVIYYVHVSYYLDITFKPAYNFSLTHKCKNMFFKLLPPHSTVRCWLHCFMFCSAIITCWWMHGQESTTSNIAKVREGGWGDSLRSDTSTHMGTYSMYTHVCWVTMYVHTHMLVCWIPLTCTYLHVIWLTVETWVAWWNHNFVKG